MIKKQQI